MNWLAGKLTRPAFTRAFTYLQDAYPDFHLTPQLAFLATATNPIQATTTKEESTLYEEEEKDRFDTSPHNNSANASSGGSNVERGDSEQSFVTRIIISTKRRLRSFAFGKAFHLLWTQLTLPIAIILWLIKLIGSCFEYVHLRSALRFKSLKSHTSDVHRLVASIRGRPSSSWIGSNRSASRGHMLRTNRSKEETIGRFNVEGSASSTSNEPIDSVRTTHRIDLDRLTSILSIDLETSTCIVEAGCTFRNLLRATTHSHLMPKVVPPFLDMTVGGAIAGSCCGSASWKNGSFIESVLEMEVVLGGSGEVITIDRDGPHAALFHALHGSYHSIATILSMKIQLVHAPRYVWMRYEHYPTVEKGTQRMDVLLHSRHDDSTIDLESFVWSSGMTLCMTSGLDTIDVERHRVLTFGSWWDETFPYYVHTLVRKLKGRRKINNQITTKDCIPLMDYLGRYEQGAFWQSSWFYSLLPWPLTGNNFLSRLLFGWCLSSSNLRATIENSPHHLDFERTRMVQDVQIPLHHVKAFLQSMLETLRLTPLWICPILGTEKDILAPNYVHASSTSNSAYGYHYVNIGIYGQINTSKMNVFDVNTELVHQVYEAGGRTMLYAHDWHTPELWSKMVDRRAYDGVRKAYGAVGAYPHAFDKVTLTEQERAQLATQPNGPIEQRGIMEAIKKEIIWRPITVWKE